MHSRWIRVFMALAFCTVSTACNSNGGHSARASSYDSIASLYRAAVAAPGFSCESLTGTFALDHLKPRFPGLIGFGTCVAGSARYFVVFKDGEQLERFVDSRLWVDLERIFEPVHDGQTFSGAAGENWLITDFDPGGGFLDAMKAKEVESHQARGSSPRDKN